MSGLLLLGYMSALESFLRALIRELVNIDEVARSCAEPQLISYGAAIHHETELLADALLETVSFAGRSGVSEALKSFLGIRVKAFTDEMGPLLSDYQRICELRHCCVHRFGKLGAKNALSLGMSTHKALLESPFTLDSHSFQEIALRLRTFAKSLNNVVCLLILDRTAVNKGDRGEPIYSDNWSWNLRRDRKRFSKYYEIFASQKDAVPSPTMNDVYESFRQKHRRNKGKGK
jgi:hypothetical protein